MRWHEIMIVMVAAALTCAAAAEQSTATGPPQPESRKADTPRCMACGATCGLAPICICEPGTKKQPRAGFETPCERICVAGCGSKPWPFARFGKGAGDGPVAPRAGSGCLDRPEHQNPGWWPRFPRWLKPW